MIHLLHYPKNGSVFFVFNEEENKEAVLDFLLTKIGRLIFKDNLAGQNPLQVYRVTNIGDDVIVHYGKFVYSEDMKDINNWIIIPTTEHTVEIMNKVSRTNI